jgi:hypothetical protein
MPEANYQNFKIVFVKRQANFVAHSLSKKKIKCQKLLTPPIGESIAINGLTLKKLTYNVLIKMINYTNSLQRTSSKNLSIFNVA